MKKEFISLLVFLLLGYFSSAQSILGKWKSVDDESGETESIIEIYKNSDGRIAGKIVKLLVVPENENCIKCKGELKDKPLIGLQIIDNMAIRGYKYTGGTIVDPKTGNQYKCILQELENDKLKVRGFLGIEALGRTQYWFRVK